MFRRTSFLRPAFLAAVLAVAWTAGSSRAAFTITDFNPTGGTTPGSTIVTNTSAVKSYDLNGDSVADLVFRIVSSSVISGSDPNGFTAGFDFAGPSPNNLRFALTGGLSGGATYRLSMSIEAYNGYSITNIQTANHTSNAPNAERVVYTSGFAPYSSGTLTPGSGDPTTSNRSGYAQTVTIDYEVLIGSDQDLASATFNSLTVTPAPAPATLLAAGIGAAGLGLIRRRRGS